MLRVGLFSGARDMESDPEAIYPAVKVRTRRVATDLVTEAVQP